VPDTAAMTAYFDGREMAMVHRMFRREFTLAAGLVREAQDVERAQLVAGHILGVANTLHHHHHMEDEHLWPLLEERCPDDIADLVALMESQHAAVAKFGAEVGESLEHWRADVSGDNQQAVLAALERFVPALFEHLEMEEARLVPLLEQHITLDEWNAQVSQGVGDVPPEVLVLGFGMVMYEGDEDLISATIANMPAEVRPVMREMASKAFAEQALALYGTTTPPRSTALA
jgi:hypothetical protein